jgi:hypothetical protein
MFMVKDSRNCSICYTEVVQMSTNCCFVLPNESFLQVSMSQLIVGVGLQTIRTWLQEQAAGSRMNSMEESALH